MNKTYKTSTWQNILASLNILQFSAKILKNSQLFYLKLKVERTLLKKNKKIIK